VIVEGMACGRAVVAIRDGGAAELFEDEVTALGCPPRDPDCLARAITRLVADPDLRRRLGLAGREAALARFDRQRLAEEWNHVYEDSGR
jgi:glycosyltransferase involved in cell wall biosynthesis